MTNEKVLSPHSLATLLKAAADPLRLDILRVLAQDSYGVLELCHIFEAKQSGMSHHLKVLSTVGLVTTRREGNSIFYRRNPASPELDWPELRHTLQASINSLPLAAEIKDRVTQVHAVRSQLARDFFAEYSAQFREKQDMIAAFDVYGPQVAERLTKKSSPLHSALEIGPGAGEFLEVLASRFDKVVALDITQAMLDTAQAHNSSFNNIDYVCDDTRWCQAHPEQFDCIVINMVLHHTPSPQQIFADVATSLKKGGLLLICELCRHEQDWVKTACGDLWQGFDPEDLLRWAQDNQLAQEQSVYFALRNGFQIQIQQFIKQ